MNWDLFFYFGSFLFNSALEFCCLIVLLGFALAKQFPSYKRILLYLTVYVSLECFGALYYQTDRANVPMDLILFVLSYSKPVIFLSILFGLSEKRNIILLYVIYVIIISISTQTIMFGLNIAIQYNDSIELLNWVDGLLNLILLLTMLLSGKIARIKNAIHSFLTIPLKTYILIICTFFCAAILQNNIFSQYGVSDFTADVSKIISIVLTALLVFLIVYLTITYNSKLSSEQAVTQLSKQIDAQIVHYKALKIYDDQLRKFRHDYENMVFCLRVLLKSDDVEQALSFIDEMDDTFNLEKPNFDSGNYIADALLRVKNIKANEFDTEIVFDGFIPSTKITNLDLCIILTNALDNAIEACQSVAGKKTISIQSEIKNGFWLVTIANPTNRDVDIRNNTVITTKSDASLHGFGLLNIQRTVQNCGGQMHLDSKEKKFSLSIALKLSEKRTEPPDRREAESFVPM